MDKDLWINGEYTISMEIDQSSDGSVLHTGCLEINGVHYHIEGVTKEYWLSHYSSLDSPGFVPRVDENGLVYILVPFSG